MIWLLLVLRLLCWFSTEGVAADSQSINIRIGKQISEGIIRAVDLQLEQSGKKIKRAASPLDQGSRQELKITCRGGRVLITNWSSEAIHSTEPVRLSTPAQMINWNGKLYRQRVSFHPNKNGCDVVNHLDLETYLDGLVNTEFNSKWSIEAVKAQVIVARTYALYQKEQARKSQRHFDLDSSTDDQVYDGFVKEDFVSSRAVDQTRGMVLKYKHKIFPTYYHSTCGGMTELPEVVWGKSHPIYRKRVICQYCVSSPRYQWTASLNTADVLTKLGLPASLSQDLKVTLSLDAASGRVKALTFLQAKRVLKKISGVELRNLIGADKLMSTRFDVIQSGSSLEFRGGGFGHGVGLCQWGTKVLGSNGKTAAEILKTYYPLATLERSKE